MARTYINGVPCTVYGFNADGWSNVLFDCYDVLFKVRNELIEVRYENTKE